MCDTRSTKAISKHAYNNGVVLTRCPGCEKYHLIADRLGWFEEGPWDIESIIKEKGSTVKVVSGENLLELSAQDFAGDKFPTKADS